MDEHDDTGKECIRKGKCPRCAADLKDKGSYIRCTECDWSLEHGSISSETGEFERFDKE